MGDLIQKFKNCFGYKPPSSLCVPMPIEWLGFGSAAFEGLSLGVALNNHVRVAMAPRHDGRIHVTGGEADQELRFGTGDYFKDPSAPWLDPLKGVLFHLHKRGVAIGGFDLAMETDPQSAGIAGSAGVLACALAMRSLFPYALGPRGLVAPPARNALGVLPPPDKRDLFELSCFCAMVSRQSLGCDAEPAEFAIAMLAKAFQTVFVDWHDHAISWLPLVGEYEVLVLRFAQSLFSVRMAELESHVRSGCEKLQIRSPRSVEIALVRANHNRLLDVERMALGFLAAENQRVTFAEKALLEGDIIQFAQYLQGGHQELVDLARPDALVLGALDTVTHHPAVLGGRLVSIAGGWAYVALVNRHAGRVLIDSIQQMPEAPNVLSAAPLVCRLADPVNAGR